MILTVDLGTTAVKAMLWADHGPVALGRSPVVTVHPAVGWAEQDPGSWWTATVDACRRAREAAAGSWSAATAIGFSTARQTFVPVTGAGDPLGRAILWSDRRAVAEGADLSVDAGSVAAKVAWLRRHQPERLRDCRWLLGPRDLLVWRMTGEVVTDETVASASGLYDPDGDLIERLVGDAAGRLPPPVAATTAVGGLSTVAARELELPAGTAVVVGAGDRQCEVVGSGASASRPSVSWGTTANVSAPVPASPGPFPDGLLVRRAALAPWQLEGGVSAAGSLIEWLAVVTSRTPAWLIDQADAAPPGARGVVALPWLGGARAPWWRDAGAAFLGLSPAHGAGDMARAAIEAVAWEVGRCLDLIGPVDGLVLVGGGAEGGPWSEIVTAVAGVEGVRRRTSEAASAGAAILAAAGTGIPLELDAINPIAATIEPAPVLVDRYRDLRSVADAAARAVMDLGLR